MIMIKSCPALPASCRVPETKIKTGVVLVIGNSGLGFGVPQ